MLSVDWRLAGGWRRPDDHNGQSEDGGCGRNTRKGNSDSGWTSDPDKHTDWRKLVSFGSTALTSCSIALESADSSADADVLKVEGGSVEMTGLDLNTRNVLVKSLLAQTRGSVLLPELISGKDTLTLTRSTFVAGPSSHTSNAAAASTIAVTVKNEQKLKIGDVTNEVTISNCGEDDG
ncbi:hypothetical protein BLNAU_2506 [Blattamonas nauphoetae]|uniref:Uncharacterized protein n=1 Tax=Blattamonas nauphoetae TaxID=2049346 RepID=A0ABQ9XR18_9EUKA|nr:hypothetical protein BLNAU_18878 [Blattamonas nauphoetae]KAK2954601.1 hypothetical protein BLNAU_10452 [Blattamonas nauphoetae]KAK2959714.1 hypothetical protein BLNAU_5203 [Blattamonas nauphoetae]KAK2960077.1 hypothetical protein BLNAU_4960 [Blattamonas nauphoetae]KAK2962673.1 hypothetical protein BLNAU_2506 [Blattamonas nauphoetae]